MRTRCPCHRELEAGEYLWLILHDSGGASTRSNGDGLSSALAWMYKHARLCNGCSYHTHVEAMKQGDAQKHTDRMWSCCRDHILS